MTTSAHSDISRDGSRRPDQAGHGWTYLMGRAAGRGLLYCAALVPVGVAALAVTLVGRWPVPAGWWRALRTRLLGAPAVGATAAGMAAPAVAGGAPTAQRRRPGPFAVAGHALLSLLPGGRRAGAARRRTAARAARAVVRDRRPRARTTTPGVARPGPAPGPPTS